MTNHDPNQSVSSGNHSIQEPSGRVTNEIEGKIIQVMESWPLQLMVETKNGHYSVGLLPNTKVTQCGQTVNTNQLNSGLKVKIQGQPSVGNRLAMTAQVIEMVLSG